MKKISIALSFFSLLFLLSCQKEINFSNGNSSGNGGGGGSISGDLLVKALQITPSTNDTNIIIFKWDGSKRLIEYSTAGKVNGAITNIKHAITRLSDGKIKKIVSTSTLWAGAIDSIVYDVHYASGSSRLSYVLSTQFTFVGGIGDSTSFTYNASGSITLKQSFLDFLGTVEPTSKEDYIYDANGNVTKVSTYTADGLGGFDLANTGTYTYDSHKNAVTLAEESYIILGVSNISKNNPVKAVNSANGGGVSYTGTFSQLQFNSFDRPTQVSLSVTPQPPGYNLKLLYYYQ